MKSAMQLMAISSIKLMDIILDLKTPLILNCLIIVVTSKCNFMMIQWETAGFSDTRNIQSSDTASIYIARLLESSTDWVWTRGQSNLKLFIPTLIY